MLIRLWSKTAGGLGKLKYNLSKLTITVAIRVDKMPDQTRSGLFLINNSMIAHAGSASPKKVRLDQINEYECFARALISVKRTLLIPVNMTQTKPSRNIINNPRLIL